jgi:hypothetical protein
VLALAALADHLVPGAKAGGGSATSSAASEDALLLAPHELQVFKTLADPSASRYAMRRLSASG